MQDVAGHVPEEVKPPQLPSMHALPVQLQPADAYAVHRGSLI